MNPARKRKVRLVVALTAAVLLSGALVMTTVSASVPQLKPSEALAKAKRGETYKVTGKVVDGSIHRKGGTTITFRVRDLEGTTSIPVTYTGSVPDPFRDGREIGIRLKKEGATFVGEKDSLVTKCPSKFTEK
ncbi:MAG: cytochrome c maturation protein CcmE [Solirubrobacteraceae bacterium]